MLPFFSGPVSEEDQNRIKQVLSDLEKDFLETYPVQFGVAICQKVKDESSQDGSSPDPLEELQLQKAPLPNEPLKKGYATKRGANVRNWKKRFFVANNASENFRIDYFDNEGGKIKGSINCAAYWCSDFGETDEAQFGPFGIRLTPTFFSRIRRNWYIRFENEEDRTAWREVIQQCCWKAQGLQDPNPLIGKACESTLNLIRRKRGYWYWFRLYGDEPERLSDFFKEVVGDEVVYRIIENIPGGMFHDTLEDAVNALVGGLIKASVLTVWTAITKVSKELQDKLEDLARQSLSKVFEYEAKMKAKAVELVETKAASVINGFQTKIFQPVIKELSKPVATAFLLAFQGIRKHIGEVGALRTPEDRKSTLRNLSWEASWHYWGHLKGSWEALENVFTDGNAREILFAILPSVGYGLIEMRYVAIDIMKDLSLRFAYTLNSLCESDPATQPSVHAKAVLRMYIHDAKLMTNYIINNIISTLVNEPLDKTLIPDLLTLVSPVQAIVDEVAQVIPGFDQLFSVNDMVSDVIHKLADDQIDRAMPSVDSTAEEILKPLESEVA